MSKHTPGPWKFFIHNRVEVVGPKDSSGWPMQVVYNCGMPDDATAIANARLIAAAPELLEVLVEITQTLGNMNTFSKARVAIAKARGETL